MFCPKCGMKLENEYKFCPSCGAMLGSTQKRSTEYAGSSAQENGGLNSGAAGSNLSETEKRWENEPAEEYGSAVSETADAPGSEDDKAEDGAFNTQSGSYTESKGTEETGSELIEIHNADYNADASGETAAKPKKQFYQKPVFWAVACSIVVAIAIISIITVFVGRYNLDRNLTKYDWEMYPASYYGSYYAYELEFDDGKVRFSRQNLFYEELLAEYSYRVVSSNEIELVELDRVISIEFRDDTMICYPSLTGNSLYDIWSRGD